jgi:hypothetical protein
MFFTVEPMINLGRLHVKVLSGGWTAVTRDRSLSAQFEHTVAVTEGGVETFTHSPKGLDRPKFAATGKARSSQRHQSPRCKIPCRTASPMRKRRPRHDGKDSLPWGGNRGPGAVSPLNPSGLVSNWCRAALIGKLSFDTTAADLK